MVEKGEFINTRNNYNCYYENIDDMGVNKMKKYTLGTFILDMILACLTGGIWLIYRLFRILSR